jgi:hypothetical protein
LGRKGVSRVVSRLYRDGAGGPKEAVIVAGVARSGTTWLAEVLASQLHGRLMFEPFHPSYVPGFEAFEYLQYMRRHGDAPDLEGFVSRVLSGEVRDPEWVDRMVSVLRPEVRIVKAVRANLMLRWILDRFPGTPTLLIVRHPCAVVASFAKLGWSARRDLDSILRQDDLLDDHLRDVSGILESPLSAHQEVAVVWCVNHRVVLNQCSGSKLIGVHYEDLVNRPEGELPRIFEAIGRDYDETVYKTLRRPSRTTLSVPARDHGAGRDAEWFRALGASRVSDIQEIVAAFGLDHLYDEGGRPTGRLRQDV